MKQSFDTIPVYDFDLGLMNGPGHDNYIEDETVGTPIEYRKGVPCPCARSETHGPREACKACRGLGFAYPENLRNKNLRVLIASQSRQRRPDQNYGLPSGRVNVVTFPSYITPEEGDLVLPLNQIHWVVERRERARNQVSNMAAMVNRQSDLELPPKQGPAEDLLRYPDALEVVGIWGWEKNRADLPEFSHADYTLVGNKIVWKPGRGPQPGTFFTVKYKAPAVLVVSPDIGYRSYAGVQLPYKTTAIKLESYGQTELGRE